MKRKGAVESVKLTIKSPGQISIDSRVFLSKEPKAKSNLIGSIMSARK